MTSKTRLTAFMGFIFSFLFLPMGYGGTPSLPMSLDDKATSHLHTMFINSPMTFEANQGQTDSQVKFLSRGSNSMVFLTPNEAVLVLQAKAGESQASTRGEKLSPTSQRSVLRMHWVSANPTPDIIGVEQLPGKSHYLIGQDSSQWRSDISHYSKVKYRNVYPGIDLVFYGNQRQLEYDFILSPGADPSSLRLDFQGNTDLAIDEKGNLVIYTPSGKIVQRTPTIYQNSPDGLKPIIGKYRLHKDKTVGFQVAHYNENKPLFIDPVLEFATYVGGSSLEGTAAMAVDTANNIYITGFTTSADFPLQNPFSTTISGPNEAFVTKLDPTGSTLLYSTFLGGNGNDEPGGISVDSQGNTYVAGATSSSDFPVLNPFQPVQPGGGFSSFVTKLDPSGGNLVYSTYLGGGMGATAPADAIDEIMDIAVDSLGQAHVVGFTASVDFPTTPNAFQLNLTGGGTRTGFITKFNAAGNNLEYSTYLGGSFFGGQVSSVALDSTGNIFTAGNTSAPDFPTKNPTQPANAGAGDVVVTVFSAAGLQTFTNTDDLLFSTYLGGTDSEGTPARLALDPQGKIHVVGSTNSTDFPTTNPFQATLNGVRDGFVTVIDPAVPSIVCSTYFGGSGSDEPGRGVTVDSQGNTYLAGFTDSSDFPVVNPVQAGKLGPSDAVIAQMNQCQPSFSTYFGGSGNESGVDVALDDQDNILVLGSTSSTSDFPITANAFQQTFGGGPQDSYVLKLATDNNTPAQALVCELKVKEVEETSQRVGDSMHFKTFNTDPNLNEIWQTLFGVDPGTSLFDIVTLHKNQIVTWAEGTLEMGGVMTVDVKTDPNTPGVKKVKIKKAEKNDGTTTFVSGTGGVNPNLADGGWHEAKIKNMTNVTVMFGANTVTGFLKELKVKLDKDSTTGTPVVKDFKIDITGVTTAADVKKGTVTSVEVTIPETMVTALADTTYEEKIKDKPEVLGGHTKAEFKRDKDALTEGVDITSLSDGFNDQLKERKGSCTVEP